MFVSLGSTGLLLCHTYYGSSHHLWWITQITHLKTPLNLLKWVSVLFLLTNRVCCYSGQLIALDTLRKQAWLILSHLKLKCWKTPNIITLYFVPDSQCFAKLQCTKVFFIVKFLNEQTIGTFFSHPTKRIRWSTWVHYVLNDHKWLIFKNGPYMQVLLMGEVVKNNWIFVGCIQNRAVFIDRWSL